MEETFETNALHYQIPKCYKDENEYLAIRVQSAISEKFPHGMNAIGTERVKEELAVIKKRGWSKYFLYVGDLLNLSREVYEEFLSGPGRGRTSCSLVCYLLDITSVDPLKFGLPFSKFAGNADSQRTPPIALDVDCSKYDIIAGVIRPEKKSDIVKVDALTDISRKLNEIGIPRLQKKLYLDRIPLNDEYTLNLFRRGATENIFQFQSKQIRDCLVELFPDNFIDLVALNAMYRPGTLELIPEYTRRKREHTIPDYPKDGMAEILDETYGLTIYQEQAEQQLDFKSAMAYFPKSHIVGQTMIAYWQAYLFIHPFK